MQLSDQGEALNPQHLLRKIVPGVLKCRDFRGHESESEGHTVLRGYKPHGRREPKLRRQQDFFVEGALRFTASRVGWLHQFRCPGTTSRFQYCGTEQEKFGVLPQVVLAVLWNSKKAPAFLSSGLRLRSRLFSPMLCPPADRPYDPRHQRDLHRTLAAPQPPAQAVQNRGPRRGISTKQVAL